MRGEVDNPELWTPTKLVSWISENFKKRGLPQPHRQEAELLVCHALNISRLDIYLQYDKPSTVDEQNHLRDLVRRRLQREPLAYILQKEKFWTLDLNVGPGVLVPRQDTEVIVETALEIIRSNSTSIPQKILEFGTGSGAISLALATECRNLVIVAIDSSEKAISYARRNINRYRSKILEMGNRLFLLCCNKFDAIKYHCRFSSIISNPPYIPTGVIPVLQAEVNRWEPLTALDGGEDGLHYYRFLKEAAEALLCLDGFLVIEHGYDQKATIQELMGSSKSLEIRDSVKDYADNHRVLVYQKKAL